MKYFILILLVFSSLKADTVGVDMDMWMIGDNGEVISSEEEVVQTFDTYEDIAGEKNLDDIPLATVIESTPIEVEVSKAEITKSTVVSEIVAVKDEIKELTPISEAEIKPYTTIIPSKTIVVEKKTTVKNLVHSLKSDFISFIMPIVEFVKMNPSQFLSLILMIAFVIYFIFFKPIINRVKNSTNLTLSA